MEQPSQTQNTSQPNTQLNAKEQLINNIKEWVKVDAEISQLKAEIKERTNKRKMLTENLVKVMSANNIENFEINNGWLVYKKSKVKKPISGKTLLTALQNYYKEDTKIAEEIAKHVMDSREESIKETIKMAVKNK